MADYKNKRSSLIHSVAERGLLKSSLADQNVLLTTKSHSDVS